MIAKINNGSSIFGAVSYNQEKVKEGHAHVISGNKMIVNMSDDPGLDFHLTLKSFENYLQANQRTEKPVVHISLNPDPKDRLTDEQYARLATDYMEKMGFGDQPYIIYKHEDINRHHLHIVTVRVDEIGKKINDSYEKLRSMDTCRKLEIKYSLHPALKKERELGENVIKKVDYQSGDVKRQISNTIRSLLQTYKFQSLGEYSALLSCYNIDVKHVKGEKFDKEYNGIVYAAKNEQGEVVSNPFKSSLFGKTCGFEGLAKIMKNSEEMLKEKDFTGYSKAVVAGAMKTARTREDFEKALRTKSMEAVFRTNGEGRIYGVTFIDHQNRVVLNGSRLGKEFSANVFHAWFNEGKKQVPATSDTSRKADLMPRNIPDTRQPISLHDKPHESSTIEEVLGVFEIKPQGEDFEETAFARRMRKKKKKGRKV